MLVGSNLSTEQLEQIAEKTIEEGDKDGDGKLSFEEFKDVSSIKKKIAELLPFLIII